MTAWGPDTRKAWRCSVCGYIHRGPHPPESCPVCGASREEFEPYFDEAPAPTRARVERWRCLVCGYVHVGSRPPDECPVCGASADSFEPLGEPAEPVGAGAGPIRVVIAGAGIAGLSAAESLRATAPDAVITLISKEVELPYYRLNLTRYLAGEIGSADLPIYPESWYESRGIRLLRGVEISAIRLDEKSVELRDGDREAFDRLVLTVGAHPFVPPLPGVEQAGVSVLRTVQDAGRILATAGPGADCVCIGGGILGLETAGALARRGASVTILEGAGWLLPRQLDQKAGETLERYVSGLGIALRKQAKTAEIVGDGRARGVRLVDGTILPADLVVVATGIRPSSHLARAAGLRVNQGIVVDDRLVTSHPEVLAAGDVAEHRGVVYGIWPASKAQGTIAGMNAAGLGAEFGGIPRSNALKVLGLELFSIGRIELEDGSFEAIDEETADEYFRFVFRDGYLVGAILLGDTRLTAAVKRAVEARRDFSDLLRRSASGPDVRAYLAAGG